MVGRASGLYVASFYIPAAFAGYLFSALVGGDELGRGRALAADHPAAGRRRHPPLRRRPEVLQRPHPGPPLMRDSMNKNITGKSGPRRWHEQRWVIDSVLRTDGLEWDQPRIAYTLRPMGVDGTPDFRVAQSRISKFADMTPVFTRSRRAASEEGRGRRGRRAARRPRGSTTSTPPCSTSPPSGPSGTTPRSWSSSTTRRTPASAATRAWRTTTSSASRSRSAAASFPPGSTCRSATAAGRIPTVIACGGMDAPKELNVNLYGDKFLQRGFAILSFDGPGQGEAPIRGVKFTPTAWVDAGEAVMAVVPEPGRGRRRTHGRLRALLRLVLDEPDRGQPARLCAPPSSGSSATSRAGT